MLKHTYGSRKSAAENEKATHKNGKPAEEEGKEEA